MDRYCLGLTRKHRTGRSHVTGRDIVDGVRTGAVIIENVKLVIDLGNAGSIKGAIGRPGLIAHRDNGSVRANNLGKSVTCAGIRQLNVVPSARHVRRDGVSVRCRGGARRHVRRDVHRRCRAIGEIDRIRQILWVGIIFRKVIYLAGASRVIKVAGMYQRVRLNTADQAGVHAAELISVRETGRETAEDPLQRRD
jgi:hypothetical protein